MKLEFDLESVTVSKAEITEWIQQQTQCGKADKT
jgi:hypothetical protein